MTGLPATMEVSMNSATGTEQERRSFAEEALRLGGKTEEEVRRMGAVDKADEQVESLFAARYQTANSPVHKAVWEGKTPLELFAAPPLAESAPCDAPCSGRWKSCAAAGIT